jgi:hypothetical protein
MMAGRDRLIRVREQYMGRDVIAPNCVEIREKDIAPRRPLGFESIALIFSIGLVYIFKHPCEVPREFSQWEKPFISRQLPF